MNKIAVRGPKILWGNDPDKPGIVENTETGERTPTGVSVYAFMNRGYWYPPDEEKPDQKRTKLAKSIRDKNGPATMEPT